MVPALIGIPAGVLFAFFVMIPCCDRMNKQAQLDNQRWEAYRDECIKYTTIGDCRERYYMNLPFRGKGKK